MLASCPECQGQVSTSADTCPHCGFSFAKALRIRTRPPRRRWRIPEPSNAGTILVLAILGWLLCGLLCILAWNMGSNYEDNCRAAGVRPDGAGSAGRILGMIGTLLW